MSLVPVMWAGGALMSYISHELAVNALTDTTSNIYSIITRLNGFSDKYVIKTLEEIDISSKLQIVEALLKQICLDKYSEKSPITISFNQLHNIVEEIEIQLAYIEKQLKEHCQKWFYRIRGCEINIEKLKQNCTTMDRRLDIFIKLLNINDHKNHKTKK